MQSKTQFDDAQVTRKVSGSLLHKIAERFTNLIGQLNQLRIGQLTQIHRRLNMWQ
jgi:hypothetical protein